MQQCWYSAWLSCAEPITDYLVLSRGSWYRTNQVTDQRCHFNRAINEPSRSFQNPCRRLLVTYNRLAVWLVKILKAVSTDHCRKASHFTVLTMFKRPLSKRMSIDLSKEEPLEVRAGGLLWSKWIFTKVRWQLYCLDPGVAAAEPWQPVTQCTIGRYAGRGLYWNQNVKIFESCSRSACARGHYWAAQLLFWRIKLDEFIISQHRSCHYKYRWSE